MKFSEFESGKTYGLLGSDTPRKVVYLTQEYLVAEIRGFSYPTVFNKDYDFKNWVEVKPKIKVYCSLWTKKSGYTWPIYSIDKSYYDRLIKSYHDSEYTLLKEWELEADDTRPGS